MRERERERERENIFQIGDDQSDVKVKFFVGLWR